MFASLVIVGTGLLTFSVTIVDAHATSQKDIIKRIPTVKWSHPYKYSVGTLGSVILDNENIEIAAFDDEKEYSAINNEKNQYISKILRGNWYYKSAKMFTLKTHNASFTKNQYKYNKQNLAGSYNSYKPGFKNKLYMAATQDIYYALRKKASPDISIYFSNSKIPGMYAGIHLKKFYVKDTHGKKYVASLDNYYGSGDNLNKQRILYKGKHPNLPSYIHYTIYSNVFGSWQDSIYTNAECGGTVKSSDINKYNKKMKNMKRFEDRIDSSMSEGEKQDFTNYFTKVEKTGMKRFIHYKQKGLFDI